MLENIHIRAEFIIEKDNVEQFKKLIREMSNVVDPNSQFNTTIAVETINYSISNIL